MTDNNTACHRVSSTKVMIVIASLTASVNENFSASKPGEDRMFNFRLLFPRAMCYSATTRYGQTATWLFAPTGSIQTSNDHFLFVSRSVLLARKTAESEDVLITTGRASPRSQAIISIRTILLNAMLKKQNHI